MVRMQRKYAKAKKWGITPLVLLGFSFAAQFCLLLLGASTGLPRLGVLGTGLAGLGGSVAAGSTGGGGHEGLRGASRHRPSRALQAEKKEETGQGEADPVEDSGKDEVAQDIAKEINVQPKDAAAKVADPAPVAKNNEAEKKRKDLPKGWHGADDEVWPKPGDWEKYGFYQIRKHFKCSQYAHDHAKPLPTLEDWDVFKKTYQEVVDTKAKFDDPVPSTLGYSFGSDGNPPPYHARHGERGRGLFATRDIKKGELVHDGTHSEVKFPTGHDWRKYIFALPRNKACDMIDWTWTQKHEGDGQLHAFTAMHIAVLCNGGNDETINVSPDSPSSMKEYALRDIAKGEEILTDYDVYETDWDEVGL